MRPEDAQKYAQLVLRIGLALVFLIFGADKWRGEEVWIAPWTDWVPAWFAKLLPVSPRAFMYPLGAFEILVGLSFLTGYLLPWTALLASLFLLLVVVFGGFDQFTIRDIGLLGGTTSLFLAGWRWKER
ncbi:MAG: DoxX family membrane protein [Candidatus Methylomirabilales bacterium]